jgi:glutathione-regulated potassium-efflux system ancillary protein KefF
MVLVVYAHPFPQRARASAALLRALEGLPGVEVRSLYDRYPDFDIDAAIEQAAIATAHAIVLQHPLYWYAMPALAKLWVDRVFAAGWAHGDGGRAVAGKRFLWAVTTGGDDGDYAPGGAHDHPFDAFVPPVRQFARYCGMLWETPIIVHGAHRIGDDALRERAAQYRARVASLAETR